MTTLPSPFSSEVFKEICRARQLHKPINSLHEGYAVILEEMDEFKEWVWRRAKDRDKQMMLSELIQIAAMCQRVAEDCGLVETF